MHDPTLLLAFMPWLLLLLKGDAHLPCASLFLQRALQPAEAARLAEYVVAFHCVVTLAVCQ